MALDVLDYDSPCPTFALAFSPLGPSVPGANKASVGGPPSLPDIKLAVGSFLDSHSENHVTIVGLDPALATSFDPYALDDPGPSLSSHFQPLAKALHLYPVTAVAFSPPQLSANLQNASGTIRTREMLATSSDCMRLWDFAEADMGDGQIGGGYVGDRRGGGRGAFRLVLRSHMANQKQGYSAPLTSFDWSQRDASLIVTSSIDTTCTVWDISSSCAVTQLIAHDREVYDVCWSGASKDIFASVGADGSVRMFDLRSLDHSTILFEAPGTGILGSAKAASAARNGTVPPPAQQASPHSPPVPPSPLLRLQFNPADPNYIAVSAATGCDLQVLDVRAPGVPVVDLRAHKAAVNGLAWSGEGMVLGTCGDDSQVLIWDLSSIPPGMPPPSNSRNAPSPTKTIRDPILAYTAPQEVNAMTWSEAHRDRVAVGLGRRVRVLRV